ncbi:(d)CMP kinase [Candidatus Dependentiae bacterium]|nr:(d)CMP kinase [Candidatus Dependentiae bacterium]
MIITIDGPAGSGKSTVAKQLAKELDIYYLYTGLLYRAVAYILVDRFKKKVDNLLKSEDFVFIKNISYKYILNKPRVYFKYENISMYLQDSKWDQPASIISSNKMVRKLLIDTQRDVAKDYDLIADGRDCGSVIFPNADYKFFLTADLETRALRVFNDKQRLSNKDSFEKVKEELEIRDRRDKERKVAPLMVPDDAIIIDNSKMNRQETIDEFLRFINM